jgi:predicted CXXCH cytochrome family protein
MNQQKLLNTLGFMQTRSQITVLMLIVAGLMFYGDIPEPVISILGPARTDSVSYDQGRTLLVSASKELSLTLLVSTQWKRLSLINFEVPGSRDNFPKEFYSYFGPGTTIQKIRYTFKHSNYYALPDSLVYSYKDTVTIKSFWRKPEFANLLQTMKNTTAENMVLELWGWRDSTYAAVYDDPNAESRSLFKIQFHLLPSTNTIYFAPGGDRSQALEYVTNVVSDPKPLADRPARFHNSELEKSCTTCHEGLPSADSGATMKADCGVCHKSFTLGTMMHAPVEMQECGSCHVWSAQAKIMEVPKGVPELCVECHADKQATIDSAKVPHPVATECTTCHSPHSSAEPHLLKKSVYDLCTGCHEDKKMNHPVGKHPVRLMTFRAGDRDEEISCVSCHEPHGSQNEHLLKMGGGVMSGCAKCH